MTLKHARKLSKGDRILKYYSGTNRWRLVIFKGLYYRSTYQGLMYQIKYDSPYVINCRDELRWFRCLPSQALMREYDDD